jgi:hypothetical protein
MSTLKRPTLRKLGGVSKVFTTVQQGGAAVSGWVTDTRIRVVPTGTSGRVGEICTQMHRGDYAEREVSKWTPQYEYEFYAEKMITKNDQSGYIELCKKWLEERPPRIPKAPKPPIEYNRDMIAEFYSRKTTLPPLKERLAVFQEAGMPEDRIKKHIAWEKMMDSKSDERQKVIDRIFGADPPVKSKSKVPKVKVIKPVKKKIS